MKNRDFNFRVWCRGWKPPRMVDFKEIRLFHPENMAEAWRNFRSDSSYILMQGTGQKDITGLEIYEGDLVGLHYPQNSELHDEFNEKASGIYEVIWRRSSFYLKQHKQNWFDKSFGNPRANDNLNEGDPPYIIIDKLPLERFNICIIIGNIYANPELLS